MNPPAISVLIPTYNGAALIGDTIASVLAQSRGDFEIVVVDDASTDDTLAVLRSIGDQRLRVIESAENGGPVVARNRAMAAARGRYIAALDQDDLCAPDRFAHQAALLDAQPATVLVASAAELLEDGVRRPWRGSTDLCSTSIRWLMMLQNPLYWSTVMFRADAARQLDPFERPEVRYAEDFDFYHRLAPLGDFAWIDAELTVYRCHGGGASRRHRAAMRASAARVLAERYAPVFGDAAEATAAMIVEHLMAREPVDDLERFSRLFEAVAALHQHFLATHAVDAAARARIDREYSRLWWRTARIALRSTRLGFRQTQSIRPEAARLAEAELDDMLLTPLIGKARRLCRTLARAARGAA